MIMSSEKKIKTIKMKAGDYGEHQIAKVDKLLKAGYSVIVIEEDEDGNEIQKYKMLWFENSFYSSVSGPAFSLSKIR